MVPLSGGSLKIVQFSVLCEIVPFLGSYHILLLLLAMLQKIYYSLQQQEVNSVECVTTITELVVVWSVCSTSKSKLLVATATHITLYTLLPQMLQGVVQQSHVHNYLLINITNWWR